MADNQDRGFYNPHSGLKGRDGGPYLDQIERQVGEQRRAVAENREPDFDNPLPATAGVPLVVAGLVVDNSLTSNPSMASRPGFELVLEDSNLGDNAPGDVTLVKPVSTLPVDQGTEPYDADAQEVSAEDVNLINTNRADQIDGGTDDDFEPSGTGSTDTAETNNTSGF